MCETAIRAMNAQNNLPKVYNLTRCCHVVTIKYINLIGSVTQNCTDEELMEPLMPIGKRHTALMKEVRLVDLSP